MKRWMLLSAALMISAACQAQTIQFTSHHGFSMATNVTSSLTWTNDSAYPFKFDSMTFNSTVANTATVQRVHDYRINQVVGNVVTTNDMGTVETNYYGQVTNVLSYVSTNMLLSVTNSGDAVYTKDDIKQLWIHAGDIVIWSFSDANSIPLLYDTTR
jgi:hypothetical protein